jgi:hypothetical protein
MEHVLERESSPDALRHISVRLFLLYYYHTTYLIFFRGKDALIDKFRNSSVLDVHESWRPKIFYSSGMETGLPEPWPAPTHVRRREKSAENRGVLFPPSSMRGRGRRL